MHTFLLVMLALCVLALGVAVYFLVQRIAHNRQLKWEQEMNSAYAFGIAVGRSQLETEQAAAEAAEEAALRERGIAVVMKFYFEQELWDDLHAIQILTKTESLQKVLSDGWHFYKHTVALYTTGRRLYVVEPFKSGKSAASPVRFEPLDRVEVVVEEEDEAVEAKEDGEDPNKKSN